MDNKKLLNEWRNRCLKKGNTPLALISFDSEGIPTVLSQFDKGVLAKVFKHLSDSSATEKLT
jgi:hypothetical protein